MKVLLFISFIFLLSCASTTEQGAIGVKRKQLMLISSEEVDSMSAQAYVKTKTDAKNKGALDKDPKQVARVVEVSKKLIPQTAVFRHDAPNWKWEVHVITSNEVNAYCMPGGKIMFYSGIIEKLKLSDGEIAAVMGHEIAHALREHGRERMSEEMLKNVGIQAMAMSGRGAYAGMADQLSAVVLTLPHSRGQESEADEIGLELMARAGYDPNDALNLWKKMAASGGEKPPEILSTHPADETRLKNIASLLPKVMPLYDKSK